MQTLSAIENTANKKNAATIKKELATAYKILAYLKYDDHTYTHISARDSDDPNTFYIYPFGLRFEEAEADSLLKVSLDGTIIEGKEYQYNRTGYIIHGAIYQKRPDIQSVFHLHTPATVAVSALKEGLMPINQWALHFHDKIAYHTYDSLALDEYQGERLFKDLGERYVMLLRHHGLLTCGRTIQEAMFYTYHLQKACETQCLTLAMNRDYLTIPEVVCEKSVRDLLSFEKNLGDRDWQAWERLIQR